MKKVIALLMCAVFLCLCACENKDKPKNNPDVSYVNVDDYTGIQRETVADWFETKPAPSEGATKESGTNAIQVSRNELPEDFPKIPAGTSNVSIIRYSPEESEHGYLSDWIRLRFSAPKQSIMQFSQDLVNAGYEGSIRFIESETGITEYYNSGWQGGWQNGKHIIRVMGYENEIDGSYAMIFDIVECTEVFYPELGQYFPVFDGYSLIPGEYSEITSNGEILKHKFDGQFHEKWQIFFAHGNAFTGVSHAQFDSYVKQLIKQGFKGTVVNERLDGCSAYLFDGINTEKGVYTSMIYNENLMSLDIVYTNVGV